MADMKLSEAQRRFLQKHERRDLAKNGFLTRFAARATWTFVRRCSDAGIVEIVDPDNRFPWSWTGTRITPEGRAALASERELKVGDEVDVDAFRDVPAFRGVIYRRVGTGFYVRNIETGEKWFRYFNEVRPAAALSRARQS